MPIEPTAKLIIRQVILLPLRLAFWPVTAYQIMRWAFSPDQEGK